jgi:hypothetical protein
MKKILAFALTMVFAFSLAACSDNKSNSKESDNNTTPSTSTPVSPQSTHYEGTAITRGSDDDIEPSATIAEAEGFSVVLDGNTSVDNTLRLTSEYQYFYIKVVNTGDSIISMTIGNDSSTQSANFYEISTGTYYIWSTKEWSASNQGVSFSGSNNMHGKAFAYLCSTSAEAETHN